MNIPLNIDWQQILLHLLNFLILAAGLYLLLYKPVLKFMKKRTEYYESQEQQANQAKEEAQMLKQEYEKRLEDSTQEINHMKSEEMKKATKDTEQLLDDAKAQSEKILTEARKEAQAYKKKVVKTTQQEMASMIVTASQKLLLKNKGYANDVQIYDEFLSSVKEDATHGEQE